MGSHYRICVDMDGSASLTPGTVRVRGPVGDGEYRGVAWAQAANGTGTDYPLGPAPDGQGIGLGNLKSASQGPRFEAKPLNFFHHPLRKEAAHVLHQLRSAVWLFDLADQRRSTATPRPGCAEVNRGSPSS